MTFMDNDEKAVIPIFFFVSSSLAVCTQYYQKKLLQ